MRNVTFLKDHKATNTVGVYYKNNYVGTATVEPSYLLKSPQLGEFYSLLMKDEAKQLDKDIKKFNKSTL